MADIVLRWNDFKGGDFGIRDPARADADQYTGENVYCYASGLLGPRGGVKQVAVTGLPAHTIVPGPMGFWKRPGTNTAVICIGTRNYEFPIAGGAAVPWAAYAESPLRSIKYLTGAGVCYSLSTGKLYKHASASSTVQVTTPAPLSYITKWGYYFVGIDQNVPWRIWFSTVDAGGAHFDQWGANDYLDIGDTEPLTALVPIFNTLYAGKQTGWNAVSGVLGTLASVRGVATGQGPTEPRSVSISTDNRIIYWPVERSPAFFNGERVAVQSIQTLGGSRQTSIGDTVLATATNRRMILGADNGDDMELYTWSTTAGSWSRHRFERPMAAFAPADPRDSTGMPEDVILAVVAPKVVGEAPVIVTYNHALDRPGNLGDKWSAPGDYLGVANPVPVAGQLALPSYFETVGRQIRVRSIIVQFRKWNMGGDDFMCEMQLRCNVLGRYAGGAKSGDLHRWFEPSARNPPIGDDPFGVGRVFDAGSDDSWRINVGEQGFGNGFQIVIPHMVGLAVREVIALCDVRSERA